MVKKRFSGLFPSMLMVGLICSTVAPLCAQEDDKKYEPYSHAWYWRAASYVNPVAWCSYFLFNPSIAGHQEYYGTRQKNEDLKKRIDQEKPFIKSARVDFLKCVAQASNEETLFNEVEQKASDANPEYWYAKAKLEQEYTGCLKSYFDRAEISYERMDTDKHRFVDNKDRIEKYELSNPGMRERWFESLGNNGSVKKHEQEIKQEENQLGLQLKELQQKLVEQERNQAKLLKQQEQAQQQAIKDAFEFEAKKQEWLAWNQADEVDRQADERFENFKQDVLQGKICVQEPCLYQQKSLQQMSFGKTKTMFINFKNKCASTWKSFFDKE